MDEKLEKLLKGQTENHIFPFFWQHGESEDLLRKYMKVIDDSHIKAVCIESRSHPDFAGPGWWHDMDIILDEASKRRMKIWILDDRHFPTGYCNGMIENMPLRFRRRFLTYKLLGTIAAGQSREWNAADYNNVLPEKLSDIENYFQLEPEVLPGDELLAVVAVRIGGSSKQDLRILIPDRNKVVFRPSEGSWKVCSLQLTCNRGPHRSYMNMLDHDSCRVLIDAVYEPHYQRYKNLFGNTIAGFFSDEPEIGNGHLYEMNQGIYDDDNLPWSSELAKRLKAQYKELYPAALALLWECDFDHKEVMRTRYTFMDQVTKCVQEDFSNQIGRWCEDHGVMYIGHLIEDNNQHAKCASSLGHYFRGLSGQHMAGIDDIGEQVWPQGEDVSFISHLGSERDGVFFHYALGRLGSSLAAIDPSKKGRAMCEIFGNYGWKEGVRLESYLIDHFLVRGINNFVPHAFSPKAFPDPDCPPHFYANGNNPQYRHFGILMQYTNRVTTLLSGGRHESEAAILYHAEGEWTGCRFDRIQIPARILTEMQMGFDFIPSDVFRDEKYQTRIGENLQVSNQQYKVLIIPRTEVMTSAVAQAIIKLSSRGFPCLFLDEWPSCICDSHDLADEDILLNEIRKCGAECLTTDSLRDHLENMGIGKIHVIPKNTWIRAYFYYGSSDVLMLTNEGIAPWTGQISVNTDAKFCSIYDAWNNRLVKADHEKDCNQCLLHLSILPQKSVFVLFAREPFSVKLAEYPFLFTPVQELQKSWKRTICGSKDYPHFTELEEVSLPDHVENTRPKFAGLIRYEKTIQLKETNDLYMEISDAGETVQLFINGIDAGIQINPPFIYNIEQYLHVGKNLVTIEVATTLERQIPPRNAERDHCVPENTCGLTGTVKIVRGNSIK